MNIAIFNKERCLNGIKIITETEKGYSLTMDSPDQGAKGIPVTATNDEKTGKTYLYNPSMYRKTCFLIIFDYLCKENTEIFT